MAQANARLALSLAIGQLQTQLGDDRRVTADGAILGASVARPNLVGVWDSAAGTQTTVTTDRAPDYASWKDTKFRKWLVSSPNDLDTRSKDYAKSSVTSNAPLLFSLDRDGFEMRADTVPVASINGGASGSIAWAVSQEATKAGIAVGGDKKRLVDNDALHAPTRPNLALSKLAKQPKEGEGWNARSGQVVDLRQAQLDGAYGLDEQSSGKLGMEYTASSRGVLSNVVKGGLKTDLSLGFELSDSQFKAPRWDDVLNPFAGGTAPQGEMPLYQPLTSGPVSVALDYSPVKYTNKFNTGSPPTLTSFRSYYNLYKHLYKSGGTTTAFYRPQSSTYWTGTAAPRGSETSISPVLDRVLYFISVSVDGQGYPSMVYTPVITLWNPYNTAVESEGFVVYPWMDWPLIVNWTVDGTYRGQTYLSHYLGQDRTNSAAGRQAEPYFLCKLTNSGTDDVSKPIRLEPGEVRVFIPTNTTPLLFARTNTNEKSRAIGMKPVNSAAEMDVAGGFRMSMTNAMVAPLFTTPLKNTSSVQTTVMFNPNAYLYFVTMEDFGRVKGVTPRTICEVQLESGKDQLQQAIGPAIAVSQMQQKPQLVALLETYHRTAGEPGQLADMVYTVNPRQRYVNSMIAGTTGTGFTAGPHYNSSMRVMRDWTAAVQTTTDGRRSFYGFSNASATGRDTLSFYDLPEEPMMSLAAFQNADLADSAFSPGAQFANAWSTPYLARNLAGRLMRNATSAAQERLSPSGLGVYDHSYLMNQAMWDDFYFSSIAPEGDPGSAGGSSNVYDTDVFRTNKKVDDVVKNWVEDPVNSPLRNPRYTLHRGGLNANQIIELLKTSAGCKYVSAHILVDGAFNVNSVNEGAWRAMLTSLRGAAFNIYSGTSPHSYSSGENTPVPRQRRPIGAAGDVWGGFRELSDTQIEALAKEIVVEVRNRGPFQSLGEFVNRRLSSDDMGLKGALQAAIDRAGLNDSFRVAKFETAKYGANGRNISDPYTGVGTPGWITQADLLTPLAPLITVRSDTFTVRGYGEAKDANGNVTARSWCEAIVQRVPEWTDTKDSAIDLPADVSPVSARFGRRFEIVSFREISHLELKDEV